MSVLTEESLLKRVEARFKNILQDCTPTDYPSLKVIGTECLDDIIQIEIQYFPSALSARKSHYSERVLERLADHFESAGVNMEVGPDSVIFQYQKNVAEQVFQLS